jgi:hypothetical protein
LLSVVNYFTHKQKSLSRQAMHASKADEAAGHVGLLSLFLILDYGRNRTDAS